MGILSWILLGLIAGALAKAIRPGRDPQGCLVTMLLGWGRVNGFNLYSLLIATAGAIIFLAIWAAITGRRDRGV
jgi:uncharacterized membrane protein YeaQ/YmgE (transglycosylase-associated protein family)